MNTDEHTWKKAHIKTEVPRSPVRPLSIYLCSSVFVCGCLLGCSGYTGPRSVVNEDPAVKIPQIRRAVDAGDRSVEPQLIKDLDSDDAAVRFYAIEALARLNDGERFDYDWTIEDRHERAAAVDRWKTRDGPSTKAAK